MKKKKIKINWLGRCLCGSENALVTTEKGSGDFLYSGDNVLCLGCGKKGIVAVYDNVAHCDWCEN